MTGITITTIVSLLSTFSRQYQELVIVNQLNNIFSFDHNIFLIESSADASRYIDARNESVPTPKSVFFFENVADNVTGLEDLKEVKSKDTFMVVVCGNVTVESNLNLLLRVKEIQRLQTSMKIGVFFSDFISSDHRQKLFRWFWKKGIIDIFVAFFSNHDVHRGSSFGLLNIFNFNPFGTFRVINATGKAFESLFLGQKPNFQNDSFRSGAIDEYKKYAVTSRDTRVWESVCSVLNATLTLVTIEADVAEEINQFFTDDVFDVVHHILLVEKPEIHTYPQHIDYVIMVVPEALPYPKFTAYLQTVTSDNFFGYSIITIVVVISLLTVFRYIKHKSFLFFQCAADVVKLLMNDNVDIQYRELSRPEIFVLLPLTFAGFVIVNGLLSTFQSYLTRPIMQPQLNTAEDIYNSPFPILAPSGYHARLIVDSLTFLSNHSDWSDKVVVVGHSDFQREKRSINSSVIFPDIYKTHKFHLEEQKRNNIKIYRIASQCNLFKYYAGFEVNPNFPFRQRINEILHWIQNAGLIEKWERDAINTFYNFSMIPEIKVESFEIPTTVLYFGWIASCVAFVIEIFWRKIKWPKRMRCLKIKWSKRTRCFKMKA